MYLAKLIATLESRKEHNSPTHPPTQPPGCYFLVSSHPEVSPLFSHALSLSLSLSVFALSGMLLVLAKGGVRCMMVREQEADSCLSFRWPEYGFRKIAMSVLIQFYSALLTQSFQTKAIPRITFPSCACSGSVRLCALTMCNLVPASDCMWVCGVGWIVTGKKKLDALYK